MLEVSDLHAFYGRAHILDGLSFRLDAGEAAVLVGRNGAGKSTTLKCLMGIVRSRARRIALAGRPIEALPPFRVARLGMAWVPEDRRVFTGLTVRENLAVGRRPPVDGIEPWTEARVVALFPQLDALLDRPAGQLSGGEQQMLTLARALMGNPKVILLDEPSEGLAPLVLHAIAGAVRAMREAGLTLLLAEQNLAFAGRLADRALVLERGRLIDDGPVGAVAFAEA
ncbi:ABC transporter ATP-binding protein [Marinivivus vitaminiproducens]|uniref:ABC transporter ATP-binding protein n=1 Tax=Marinivivus vitaminiproducens TaxID=3035935 RepID=UPI0027A5B396|nr:ABC transporter ATP-binding protein [Geminicoccaceae bacterium SCSIO 64248]